MTKKRAVGAFFCVSGIYDLDFPFGFGPADHHQGKGSGGDLHEGLGGVVECGESHS